MDTFVHLANVLYLASYLVRDILWLRLLTVFAALCLIPFYYLQPIPLTAPIVWNLVFTAINVYQIYLLLLERRPVQLAERERRLHQLAFQRLKPRELLALLKLASWRESPAGAELCPQDAVLDEVMVLYSGSCSVRVDGREVAALQPGQFLGEMSFLTEGATSASVSASEAVRYVAWPKDELKRFLGRNADLRAVMQGILGVDLVGKLRRRSAPERAAGVAQPSPAAAF